MFKTPREAFFFVKMLLILFVLYVAVSSFYIGDTTGALMWCLVAVLLKIEANTAKIG